jgi:hypothetical protein
MTVLYHHYSIILILSIMSKRKTELPANEPNAIHGQETSSTEAETQNNEETEVDNEEDDEGFSAPVMVTLPPNCRLTENSIVQLHMLFDCVHPRQMKKDLMGMLLNYLRLEDETLPESFKETAENYLLLFQWLDVVEQEMDEMGFAA